jgi:hypothetical protein
MQLATPVLTMNEIYIQRCGRFIRNRIVEYNLDLSGLTVATELGSGNYAFTCAIAALANAEKVYAISRTSRFGTFEQNCGDLEQIISNLNIENKITVVNNKNSQILQDADILTNSGFVRPIDREVIDDLKPTTVIPLMWETWEFRREEIDLPYARNKGILILGTNESKLGINIFGYRGFLVSKLFFECGLELHTDRVLLIGSGRLGNHLAKFFLINNINFRWISFDECLPDELNKFIVHQNEASNILHNLDAIIFAEHMHPIELLGKNGVINASKLSHCNPLVQLIQICGCIDKEEVDKNSLAIYPKDILPFGHMTVSADYLGPKATLELNTAGLKVGEIMARNRRRYDLKEAYCRSIVHNIVDDFPGGFMSYQTSS